MSDSVQTPPPKKMYRRLPGRGLKWSTMIVGGDRQALYLGPDHVLALRRSGYDESAKRFQLSEIQAITFQTNATRTVIGITTGAVLALVGVFVGMGLSSGAEEVYFAAILFGSLIGLPFLGIFLVNLALGPTCSTYLHTAVQVEPLTALSRVRAARRCMAILAPRIDEAQGALMPEQAAALAVPAPPFRASANALDTRPRSPQKPLRPGLPMAVYITMMVFAGSALADVAFVHPVKDFVDLVLFGGMMVLLMVVVIRQINSTLPAAARRTNWVALIYNSFAFIVTMYAFMIAQAITMDQPPSTFTMMMLPGTGDMPQWLYYLYAALFGVNALIALFGFATLRGYSVTVRPSSGDSAPPA